jgi:hypothetical protein
VWVVHPGACGASKVAPHRSSSGLVPLRAGLDACGQERFCATAPRRWRALQSEPALAAPLRDHSWSADCRWWSEVRAGATVRQGRWGARTRGRAGVWNPEPLPAATNTTSQTRTVTMTGIRCGKLCRRDGDPIRSRPCDHREHKLKPATGGHAQIACIQGRSPHHR